MTTGTRPSTSQADRDVLEDNGLGDVEDSDDEPALLSHEELMVT